MLWTALKILRILLVSSILSYSRWFLFIVSIPNVYYFWKVHYLGLILYLSCSYLGILLTQSYTSMLTIIPIFTIVVPSGSWQ